MTDPKETARDVLLGEMPYRPLSKTSTLVLLRRIAYYLSHYSDEARAERDRLQARLELSCGCTLAEPPHTCAAHKEIQAERDKLAEELKREQARHRTTELARRTLDRLATKHKAERDRLARELKITAVADRAIVAERDRLVIDLENAEGDRDSAQAEQLAAEVQRDEADAYTNKLLDRMEGVVRLSNTRRHKVARLQEALEDCARWADDDSGYEGVAVRAAVNTICRQALHPRSRE